MLKKEQQNTYHFHQSNRAYIVSLGYGMLTDSWLPLCAHFDRV